MKPCRSCSGFTLTEVMIGIFLMAIVVSSIMAVVLSVRRGVPRSDRKMIATNAAKNLLDQLKNYVTADASAANGPGLLGSWALPGDGGAACACGGACGGAALNFALSTGCGHDAASMIPARLPLGVSMTMCYCVQDITGPGALAPYTDLSNFTPQVNVTVNWNETAI